MSAVKRNIPARMQITVATSGQSAHLVEIFEETTPTPRLVNRVELTKLVDFPTRPPGDQVVFQGDGRTNAPGPLRIDVRGIVGASAMNIITIWAHPNGRVQVEIPTDWN
jgi:hypothetical protein